MGADEETGLPASIEAAWGRHERPARGPKPGLSLERIVDAAVAVAAADGIGAVSMSRVAADLGVTAMALYRYVAAKEELLVLMVDAGGGRPPAPVPGEDWRAGLTRWAWGFLDILRRNPWLLRIPISGPPVTPNQLAWLEDGLHSLGDTRLAEGEKASVVLMLSGYVRNEASLEASLAEAWRAAEGTGRTPMSGYGRLLATLTTADAFPALHRTIAAGVFDGEDPVDAEFAFGLERLLDGVAVLVAERAGPG